MTAGRLAADHRDALRAAARGALRFDEPLARHTTLRIGGPADAWYEPADADALPPVLLVAARRALPVTVVGGGSNLLVRDGGVRGLVIATRSLRGVRRTSPTGVFVEAGLSTGALLRHAIEWELGGLELLGGVPGSIGGGLVMNAGTLLGELKDVTVDVTSLRLADGAAVIRPRAACGFGYRHSALPPGEIVVSANLELRPRPRADIEADVRALKDRRADREPRAAGVAGSAFKNPPGDFAGRLIEQTGLKGRRVGGAEISPVHANWIVNTGGARAADVLALIEIARQTVADRFGVTLELELKLIGQDT